MTRMWMVDVKIMCNQHLLGEHKEIHQLVGTLKKGYSVGGYVKNNCIEISSIEARHNEIVEEMKKRGMNGHKSPILSQDEIDELASYLPANVIEYKVNVKASLLDLIERCGYCHERFASIEV